MYREDRGTFSGLGATGPGAQRFLPALQIPWSQTESLICFSAGRSGAAAEKFICHRIATCQKKSLPSRSVA